MCESMSYKHVCEFIHMCMQSICNCVKYMYRSVRCVHMRTWAVCTCMTCMLVCACRHITCVDVRYVDMYVRHIHLCETYAPVYACIETVCTCCECMRYMHTCMCLRCLCGYMCMWTCMRSLCCCVRSTHMCMCMRYKHVMGLHMPVSRGRDRRTLSGRSLSPVLSLRQGLSLSLELGWCDELRWPSCLYPCQH